MQKYYPKEDSTGDSLDANICHYLGVRDKFHLLAVLKEMCCKFIVDLNNNVDFRVYDCRDDLVLMLIFTKKYDMRKLMKPLWKVFIMYVLKNFYMLWTWSRERIQQNNKSFQLDYCSLFIESICASFEKILKNHEYVINDFSQMGQVQKMDLDFSHLQILFPGWIAKIDKQGKRSGEKASMQKKLDLNQENANLIKDSMDIDSAICVSGLSVQINTTGRLQKILLCDGPILNISALVAMKYGFARDLKDCAFGSHVCDLLSLISVLVDKKLCKIRYVKFIVMYAFVDLFIYFL